jgi:glutathione S-transferase
VNAAPPILYSFRRCPYAMRARMALAISAQPVEHREVLLRDKPAAMLASSPKGTVPVLILPSGQVIDESLDIMLWALHQNDPQNWLEPNQAGMRALIAQCDGPFKQALDAYKYARTPAAQEPPRALASDFMAQLESRLNANTFLFGPRLSLADAAIMPFVRQFAAIQSGWFSQQPWPRLQGWLAQMAGSALFEDSMRKRDVWAEVA